MYSENPHALLMGMLNGTVITENSREISQKIKNRTTIKSSDSTSGHLPKDLKTLIQKEYMHSQNCVSVQSFVLNSFPDTMDCRLLDSLSLGFSRQPCWSGCYALLQESSWSRDWTHGSYVSGIGEISLWLAPHGKNFTHMFTEVLLFRAKTWKHLSVLLIDEQTKMCVYIHTHTTQY